MSQSGKLFIVLGFMFVIYTTMNGHLQKYLQILFGGSGTAQNNGNIGSAAKALGQKTLSDVIGKL